VNDQPQTLEITSLVPDSLDRCLQALSLPCRIVGNYGRVLWQSGALTSLLNGQSQNRCCESLGFRHTEAECPSRATIQTGKPQRQPRWLGRVYVIQETVPLSGLGGEDAVSFEYFRDVTTEKKLESAFSQQQELLETINKAMIEINHHLEDAQRELQQKNQSLELANDQLRSLDQMKDEFISIVSHELKAPLTSIKGSVELIQTVEKDKLSPTGFELLTICRRSTDRLHMLVQDLLDVARIESGRLSLSFARFNVHDTITECLQSMQTLAGPKGVTLENQVAPGLDERESRWKIRSRPGWKSTRISPACFRCLSIWSITGSSSPITVRWRSPPISCPMPLCSA
jgi:signal transduction histidine kinase